MLMLRLQRIGKKKSPSYRLIVSEKTKDTQAGSLENLGTYNPVATPKGIDFKEDRIKYWLSVGAQASASVNNLLVKAGIVEGNKEKSVFLSKKRKGKLEAKVAEKAEKEEAKAKAVAEAKEKEATEAEAKVVESAGVIPTEVGKEVKEEPSAEENKEEASVEETPVVEEVKEETSTEPVIKDVESAGVIPTKVGEEAKPEEPVVEEKKEEEKQA